MKEKEEEDINDLKFNFITYLFLISTLIQRSTEKFKRVMHYLNNSDNKNNKSPVDEKLDLI